MNRSFILQASAVLYRRMKIICEYISIINGSHKNNEISLTV